MSRCEPHGTDLDAQDCAECEADRAASLAEYQRHGGYHPNLRPLAPGEHTPGLRVYPEDGR